jgi:hypothetical protein
VDVEEGIGLVIELAEVVSVLGGAGGVWSVSGRCVSRSDDDGWDDGICEDDDEGGTMCCFGGSCVEIDNDLRQPCCIEYLLNDDNITRFGYLDSPSRRDMLQEQD